MWKIEKLTLKPVELDFNSIGFGIHETHAIIADGNVLVNAVDLAEFDRNPVQVVVCEVCGCTGCRSGGWTSLRRFGERVLWIPAFSMVEHPNAISEFLPPSVFATRGVPVFDSRTYEGLRRKVPALPSKDSLKSLSNEEAVRLAQWEAPGQILGQFFAPPALYQDVILAVHRGELDEQIQRLVKLLAESLNQEPAIPTSGAHPITFYLDLPGIPEWSPIAEDGEKTVVLHFGEVAQIRVGR